MNQENYSKNYIKKCISEKRIVGEHEQDIYNCLVSEGYDRGYVIEKMVYMVHPKDAKKAKNYTGIMIGMIILGILFQFISESEYAVYNIIFYIVFIYFFAHNNITAYYWYLFFAILQVATSLPALLAIDHISILVGSILLVIYILPIALSYKIINILLPHKDGSGIGITQNGIHIFQTQ